MAAVLRPEEAARLHDLRDLDSIRCAVCGRWVEPGSSETVSVSISLEGGAAIAEFAHRECSPSRADLAELVVMAQSEPRGISYVQAMHPEAGAVLLWERKLDLRVRAAGDGNTSSLYLDADWWDGFHFALGDEPVRLLVGWRLGREADDLVLRRGDDLIERFHGGAGRPPPGWLEALDDSGFCLLIVGAGLSVDHPGAEAVQAAIRARRAMMGLVECDES